jgi:hypothetical protein
MSEGIGTGAEGRYGKEVSGPPEKRGVVQNIASQLAQLSVGWEFASDGPTLRDQPTRGAILLDLVAERSTVNGHPANVHMLYKAMDWLGDDLMRLHKNHAWVSACEVTLQYNVLSPPGPPGTDISGAVQLHASSRVVTVQGEATGRFGNSQPLDAGLREPPATEELRSWVRAEIRGAQRQVDWLSAQERPTFHADRLADVDLFKALFHFLQTGRTRGKLSRRPSDAAIARAQQRFGESAALNTQDLEGAQRAGDAARAAAAREKLEVAERLRAELERLAPA